MDYLDPSKEFRHRIILYIGYVFIGFGIAIATMVLVYQAYGFGLNKNGGVVQNGLLFISSHPNPAVITINGKEAPAKTDARIVLPANIYKIVLNRAGYRTWQRTVDINGSRVLHVDYPILIPNTLKSTAIQTYASQPGFATQSLDRRWYMVQAPGSFTSFDVYDLKSTTKNSTTIELPESLPTKSDDSQSWQLAQWADDNQHVLLRHNFGSQSEYILVDRSNPDQSLNLTSRFAVPSQTLSLINRKYDRYYAFDSANATVDSYSLNDASPQAVLSHVLTFKSYGDNQLLYVTDLDAPTGKVLVKQQIGSQNVILRTLTAGTTYLLDFTKYSGTEYVVIGATIDNKVYIYRDPVGQLRAQPKHAIVPQQVLHVPNPDYVSFSPNAQFIVTEHQNQFGVYDIENQTGYNFSLNITLPAAQPHVTWMDGSHLTGINSGKAFLVDYDGTNMQPLVKSNDSFIPAFSVDFKMLYTLSGATQTALNQTPLVVPGD